MFVGAISFIIEFINGWIEYIIIAKIAEILIKEPYWEEPRKITVEEGLALMGYNNTFAKQYGFKHGFTFPETMSKAQIYKQLGNSLVPEIVSEIASILVKK